MNQFGSINLVSQNPKDDTFTEAQIGWLTDLSDWRFVKRWKLDCPAAENSAARDALEYATLAGKRWRFLREQQLTVSGWQDLIGHLQREPAAELGLAIAVTTFVAGQTSVLGVAFARRTWANNLILEFLATSPQAMSGLKGTGFALMHSLAVIGHWLSCGELWGECTGASRGFYMKLMRMSRSPRPDDITDRFQFKSAALRRLARNHPGEITPCPPPALNP